MADQAEKTYPALPSRRRKFRERGEFAQSHDLTAAGSFLAAALAVAWGMGPAARACFEAFAGGGHFEDNAAMLARELKFAAIAPMMLAVAAFAGAVLGTMAQGLVFAPVRMSFNPSRLNPLQYFTRMFSSELLVQLAKPVFGLLAIGAITWNVVTRAIAAYPAGNVTAGLVVLEDSTRLLTFWACAVMILLGFTDYAYRFYQFENKLRMTRQEFLDELKEEEGNPQIKRRRLKLMRQRARKSAGGLAQVATSTVVLVNPTHYAVALRYRRGFDRAPLCVAKGAGEAAARIIGIAKLAAIPVVSNPPLCRALFQTLEIGQEVSTRFYRAVAEVLAALMRAELKARAARAEAR
jgi:flagellar biosynthetic protein FlhB